jgi:hypothetical protein
VGSPYAYTQQAASACFVTDPLVAKSALPDGGTQYTYRQASGNLVSEPIPPAGFDPVTASASQLAEYGLEPRPTSPSALSDWNEEMGRVWFAKPLPFLAEIPAAEQGSPPPPPPLLSSPGIAAVSNPGIFAGYQTQSYYGTSPSYTSASDTFYEPHLYGTGCSNPGLSTWAGIGTTSGPFGQDGTDSFDGHPNHEAFWQVWNNDVEQSTAYLFSVPAGDLVRANVNYQADGGFSGTVTDVTTGKVRGWSMTLFLSTAPDAGEAIVENVGGFDLANFRTLTFASSTANGTALNSLPPPGIGQFNIVNGTARATTNAISGNGSFTVTQNHC